MLNMMEDDRKCTNKYTQSYADKNIKTANEEAKDRNLHVMELLDLETRRLRNEQTKAGLTQYANLAKDFREVLDNEEKDLELREQFKNSIGEDGYTDEGFQQFKSEREKNLLLEEEIRKDNEEFLEADGDDDLDMDF